MDIETIIAILTSVLGFVGVVLTVRDGNKKTNNQLKEHDELLAYRIKALEDKQDKHNSVIERMYNVENRINVLDERLKVANNRIKDLEEANICPPSSK